MIHARLQVFVLTLISFASVSGQASRVDACPNDAKEFHAVEQKAGAKDPAAQTTLASCYDLGWHVQPDGKESIRLLTEAAEQGYTPAQYEVGRIYLYGRGVPIDYAKALLWEQKAAEKGDPRAQRDLAFMYERGFGVPADPTLAAKWNRKAAGQGNPEAQAHLARALDEGAGVGKNPGEAHQLYTKAAKQEQPAAQLELARKLAQKSDCAGAIHWYKEAAAHGQTAAMYELGKLYLTGRCGGRRIHAFTWFSIGGRFGSEESKAEATELARTLTLGQKKGAQIAAEQWIKAHPGSDKDEDEKEKEER
jgi:TPR repeat protein